MRAAGEKDVGDIRTLMEEVDMRIGETKNATYEFKRDIIMGGEDAHTGTISADKVIRCGGRVLGGGGVCVCVCVCVCLVCVRACVRAVSRLAHRCIIERN